MLIRPSSLDGHAGGLPPGGRDSCRWTLLCGRPPKTLLPMLWVSTEASGGRGHGVNLR